MRPVKKSLRCVAALLISTLWSVACYPTVFSPIAQESDTSLSAQQWSNVNLKSNINTLNPVHQNQVKNADVERLSDKPQTIFVSCHEDAIEIVINADLFDAGVLVDARDLWLGADCRITKSSGPCCGAVVSGPNHYTITGKVADCGTKVSVTDQTVDYTNVLIYSPIPSSDGVVLLEGAVVPIKCQYIRKYNVNISAVVPTWVPFDSSDSSVAHMDFEFRLMTDDWQHKRSSAIYLLGDTIHLEASVSLGAHLDLQVFVDSCVATPFSSAVSDLKYIFVDNHGCFTDGLYSASESHFLPRVQGRKLQMLLKTFVFRDVAHNLICIACRLKAVPTTYASNVENRACSFIDNRWKSADGDDQVCSSCAASGQDRLKTEPALYSPIMQALPAMPAFPQHLLHTHPDEVLKQVNDQPASSGLSVHGTASEWVTVLGPLVFVTQKNEPTSFSSTALIDKVYAEPRIDQPKHLNITTASPVVDQVVQQTPNSIASTEDGSHNTSDLAFPLENDAVVADHKASDVALEMNGEPGQDGENTTVLDPTVGVPTWFTDSHPTTPTESYIDLLNQSDQIFDTSPEMEEMESNMVQQSLSTPLQGLEKIPLDPLLAQSQEENAVFMNPFSDPLPNQLPVLGTTVRSAIEEMQQQMFVQNSNGILEDPFNTSKYIQGPKNGILDPLF